MLRRAVRTIVVAALLLFATLLAGCGDGTVIVIFNSGVVVGDPSCQGDSGNFQLQNEGGLLLLVVINSGTVIVNPRGLPGMCTDVTAGEHAQVRGPQHGTTVTAESITLQ